MSGRIGVTLGTRSYGIHVGDGLLSEAGQLLAPFASGTVPVVSDNNVAPLHLDNCRLALGKAGISTSPIIVDAGEGNKNFAGLERLAGALLDCGIERGGLVVALGGGVIGDLVGFAAGIIKRGVDYAQVPTTLLAQVDSSVGGKTGIDTSQGKNLIGIFHQPRIVIADIGLLSTLPRRELLAGYAEVAKYGALGDADFFGWLEAHAEAALAGDRALLESAVTHSCRMKAAIVSRDERETGVRALLNLGHTFGHALEAATGYSQRLLHGEGVAIGMVLAFRLSARLGLSPATDAERLQTHLRAMGLPAAIEDIPGPRPGAEELLEHMLHDKKKRGGQLTFILARGIGHAFATHEVPQGILSELLVQ